MYCSRPIAEVPNFYADPFVWPLCQTATSDKAPQYCNLPRSVVMWVYSRHRRFLKKVTCSPRKCLCTQSFLYQYLIEHTARMVKSRKSENQLSITAPRLPVAIFKGAPRCRPLISSSSSQLVWHDVAYMCRSTCLPIQYSPLFHVITAWFCMVLEANDWLWPCMPV